MQPTIFSFIRRHSWRQQLLIVAVTVAMYPVLYATFELPKMIVNDALGQDTTHDYFGFELSQVEYLWALCAMFLIAVLISGGIKYFVQVYKGVIGERMLRRLRYELYSHILRFPLPHFRRVSQGELVQMINAEVEPVGGFAGDAYATVALQGGTLLTILTFTFLQDPVLGVAAISLYPFQAYVIPKLQAQVNQLGKQRVRQVRRLAEKISETVQGVREIRASDATRYERARFTKELGIVYYIRLKIYKKKFLIKFINNFLAQFAPFLFYSIGGYLVLQGDVTIGALVAVLTAHEKMASPWKELLAYYQLMMDVRIKYDQVINQFFPNGIIEEARQEDRDDISMSFDSQLRASNLSFSIDADQQILDGLSFEIELPKRVAIIGPAGAGKEELSLIMANILAPDSGREYVGETEITGLPDAITSRHIGYVGNPGSVMSGTIQDNLFYSLKRRPFAIIDSDETEEERQKRLRDNALAGNSELDIESEWTDYESIGLDDARSRLDAASRTLRLVLLEQDIYQIGLRSQIDATSDEELGENLLKARQEFFDRISNDERLSRLVEIFDPDRYNTNATLGENLLFGTPIDENFDVENLAEHPYVMSTIERVGLVRELQEVGYTLASTMVELFADLPPDHEYFRQFSFIQADDLPEYRNLLSRTKQDRLDDMSAEDGKRLLALPFKLIPARHRLGLVEDELRSRILEARHDFRENLPGDMKGSIAFFDPSAYNSALTIQENILFGKIAYGQAQAQQRVGQLLNEILERLNLKERVVAQGLAFECGSAGTRLSAAQRQKLAIAQQIIKKPEILVLHDSTGPLDSNEQTAIRQNLLEEYRDRSIFWVLNEPRWARYFDFVLVLRRGKIVESGTPDELAHEGTLYHELTKEE